MAAVTGLDLSLTSSGIAHADGTATHLDTSKERGMDRLGVIADAAFTACQLDTGGVDLVVIEGYSYMSKGRAIVDIGEMGGVVRYQLYCYGQPYAVLPPKSLKLFATGNGNASKHEMIVWARDLLRYGGFDEDEADALWLRAAGLHAIGAPLIKRTKAQTNALAALDGTNGGNWNAEPD